MALKGLITTAVPENVLSLLHEMMQDKEMLSFFEEKYDAANVWHAEKSLSFFDDAENEPNPKDLTGRTWDDIKQIISQSLKLH